MSFLLFESGSRISLENEDGFLRTESAIDAETPAGRVANLAVSRAAGRVANLAASRANQRTATLT